MSIPNEPANKELAERLWNQQGGHEEQSSGDWLEAEYRAHPQIAVVQNEVDVRMRGLGPLPRNDLAEPPQSKENKILAFHSVLLVAGVCLGIGVLYSVLRRFSTFQRG